MNHNKNLEKLYVSQRPGSIFNVSLNFLILPPPPTSSKAVRYSLRVLYIPLGVRTFFS